MPKNKEQKVKPFQTRMNAAIGVQLKSARKKSGLTVRLVAWTAGTSESLYRRAENGNGVSCSALYLYCFALNVSAADLLNTAASNSIGQNGFARMSSTGRNG